MNVVLFRAIDEMSTVLIGDEIDRALTELQRPELHHRLVTVPRRRLPFRFRFAIRTRILSSDAVNSYFARLVYYPLVAMFQRGDVYHITDDAYGAVARVLNPRRCVVTFNHATPHVLQTHLGVPPGPALRIHRFIFDGILRAAYIVTASDYMREHILAHYPVDPSKVVRNYYGRSAVFFPRDEGNMYETRRRFHIPEDRFIVLHVGNCGPAKNVEAILLALAQLPDRIHFVQAGGWLGPSHQAILRQHGLASRVHCMGVVRSRTDLARLYCSANVFVFPSILEGFGLPIVEAMASGLPVVTSNYGTMAEIAKSSAILVDPGNPADLATAILALERHPEQRRQLRAGGLERATHFSWNQHAQTLCDLYRDVHAATRERARSVG